ncbi:hypothetical protein [Actinomadura fibrosa]|uniref:Uncharacterized protein n=1 Tax=Actinomadura fibrosa TaxID=111802 RepID=A0ABW2XC53_9ACTN|nr:hypothetical protein [Actinomadura fibrosa]
MVFSRLFRRRRADELAVIDAEITAFGEALARHTLDPERHGSDADLMADYARALDAYERAKAAFVGDRDREDAEDVLLALDEGRHALACVDARQAGRPVPPRRPLCFFDPRHGPSVERVPWAPEAGATRIIDVCAADAVRLADGEPPIATGGRRSPGARPAPAARPARTPRRAERVPAPRPVPAAGATPAASSRAAALSGETPHRAPAAFKTCPPGIRKSQQAQGQGNKDLHLPYRKPRVPLVLVVRHHGGGRFRVLQTSGAGSRVLHRGSDRDRVVEPLPPDDDQYVRVSIRAIGRWAAWLQPADTVPVVQDQIASRGSFVFRHAGGPAHVRMTHKADGDYSLTELSEMGNGFEQGQVVLAGRDQSHAEGQLTGPGYLHVRAEGDWRITIA